MAPIPPIKTPPLGTPAIDPHDKDALLYGKMLEVAECVSGMRMEMGAHFDATNKRIESIENRVEKCETHNKTQDEIAAKREAERRNFRAWVAGVAAGLTVLAGVTFAVVELFLKH